MASRGRRTPPAGKAQERPPRPLDDVDRNILKTLRDNSRLSMSELARQVNVSRANAYARVDRLKASGVIQGYTVRVNAKKLGLGVAALIAVSLDQRHWRAIRDELTNMPQIEYYAVTAGEFDVILLVRAATMDIVRDVILDRLSTIEGVRSTQTHFILDETTHRPVVL